MDEGMSGPNRLAAVCTEQIPKIQAMLAAEKDNAERKRLNRWLADLRRLERFTKSRAGYIAR